MIYRKASAADIDSVARVHIKAFPGFFLTKLGYGFLCELYRGFLSHTSGVFLVCEAEDGQIIGFAAGTLAPEQFFYDLRKERSWHFLMSAIPALFKNPSLVFAKLYSAIFYKGDKPSELEGGALLSSIGILPELIGKSIGAKLLFNFEAEIFSHEKKFIYLTTDEANNEKVNYFYTRNGYLVESRFMQGGKRPMLRYIKRIKEQAGVCDE